MNEHILVSAKYSEILGDQLCENGVNITWLIAQENLIAVSRCERFKMLHAWEILYITEPVVQFPDTGPSFLTVD